MLAGRDGEHAQLQFSAIATMKRLFRAIHVAFRGNPAIEEYLHRVGYMEKLMSRLAYGLGAEECLADLISSNYQLMKNVNPGVINKFGDFIRNLGPDAEFLRFMQSMYSQLHSCCII